ncbi:MAG: endonuclease [Phycisphaerae bacterium]|nr:endonuclease [Phycisphaerae bacterium]NIW70362.1 endonuclease [candidate division KSB1 bacterium]NIP56391.1 endonuclease [Phycisphaerae bacterium]NIS54840.1 endonuclease [Phycisphaerae bacterium]NIU12393.1 endonuclease [Phycisphaerae bacterium]
MSLRMCSYNIEWFNHLFNKDNSLKNGAEETERLTAIKNVLTSIQPDFIGIVEAPNTSADGQESTVKKLEAFANFAGLPTKKAVTGFVSPGTQEIAALYNPAKLTVVHAPGGDANLKKNPPFDGEFFFDTDDDRIKEVYKHYRPPLEVLVTVEGTGRNFNVIVVHSKSKGIFNSADMLHWERESLRNRLKLYAECEWIRRHVDELLKAQKDVIVMGDMNDGPGMDYYEIKYGRSAIEVVMGDIFEPGRILLNHGGKPKWTSKGWKPSSARFKDTITEKYVNVLIDHVLASSGLPVVADKPHKIWNPFENDDAKPLKSDLLKASDHFPVTLDLDL